MIKRAGEMIKRAGEPPAPSTTAADLISWLNVIGAFTSSRDSPDRRFDLRTCEAFEHGREFGDQLVEG